jgi:transcriptional regulator with PAS, ATPase and Fis domain
MKTLISWIAYKFDFNDNGIKVSPNSPNYSIHKYRYDYEQHIILYAKKEEEKRVNILFRTLSNDFPKHKINRICLGIEDVINVKEIKTKVETFLLKYRTHQLEIFISPGTPAMQVVWYILAMSVGQNIKLLQGRPPEHSKTGKPEFFEVQVEKSQVPVSAIIKEISLDEIKEKYPIGKSIKHIFEKAWKIASTAKVSTLIRGETGTGKEYLARYIHDNSIRKDKKFIPVNCTAIPDLLLASILFGYKKGAFTGAMKDTKGIFEDAEGGTIFLDEIGDISQNMQQSLLRVVQHDEILPVGETTPKNVDVRIITATNKNLEQLCKEGKFRWDLYWRLIVTELELPSLIERGKDESKELINYFLKEKAEKFNKGVLKIDREALNILMNYSYPGNIRELENMIESFYVFCEREVKLSDLPKRIFESHPTKPLKWKDVERDHIEYILKLNNNNQSQALKVLGYGSINTLKNKIKEYRIKI